MTPPRQPGTLKALASKVLEANHTENPVMQIRRMRERGKIPSHYTATTICDHCGVVPIFPGVGKRVAGCVWCFRRVRGLPIPRVRR